MSVEPVDAPPVDPPVVDPPVDPPLPWGVTRAELIARIRSIVGDFAAPFRDEFLGTGEQWDLDLSETNVAAVSVFWTERAVTRPLDPAEYRLDVRDGKILLAATLPRGVTLTVVGIGQGLFADADLDTVIDDAMAQHTFGRTVATRYRDPDTGFIVYREVPITMDNLPVVEIYLVSLLASIMLLWQMAADASTDVDIITAEGTTVPRSQRFRQLLAMIDALQDKYNTLAGQLNVGLGRVESYYLRRVSLTTNRLVPLFKPREYDDATYPPRRLLPPIEGPYEDHSGVPSPWRDGAWG